MRKNIISLLVVVVVCILLNGCAYQIGNVRGVINPLVPTYIDMGYYGGGYYGSGYYQSTPVCRPWGGQIICENVAVPQTMYYSNPPVYLNYGYSGWWPGNGNFIYVQGVDRRIHRHSYNPPAPRQHHFQQRHNWQQHPRGMRKR